MKSMKKAGAMKAAPKAMKAMKKSMKAMKKAVSMKKMKKVKKVSKVGRKWQVLKGTKEKTKTGLKASDLTKNKSGKVVSKKKQALGKKNAWIQATIKARKSLGLKGMVVIGGKSAQGQALLKKARSFYKA